MFKVWCAVASVSTFDWVEQLTRVTLVHELYCYCVSLHTSVICTFELVLAGSEMSFSVEDCW